MAVGDGWAPNAADELERLATRIDGPKNKPTPSSPDQAEQLYASRRDGIIHRAHEVSAAKLSDGIRDARKFIERFSKQLLNLDFLQ